MARLALEQYADMDSASALIYESAKQCINAIASQYGENPGTTRAKVQFLSTIASRSSGSFDLMRGWQAAISLHFHADRGHLTTQEFYVEWELAQTFIEEMLIIYSQNEER